MTDVIIAGCLDELLDLLEVVNYDAGEDELVLVGDLVNKGPQSAQVVRWARERVNAALSDVEKIGGVSISKTSVRVSSAHFI
ncbi:hypothetical protein T492DRAFT_77139 [Pavlovales sp. CCMP2436]|nr:hypothetical protein T492DRAFT_77139 [Pavlovales sp. CCMP2436]